MIVIQYSLAEKNDGFIMDCKHYLLQYIQIMDLSEISVTESVQFAPTLYGIE